MKALSGLIVTCFFLVSSSKMPANETFVIRPIRLTRTNYAQHVGRGDEEFKKREAVHLTGLFSLKLENGLLVGEFYANFKEIPLGRGKGPNDDTEFISNTKYTLYIPKKGYSITEFKVLYDTKTSSSLDFYGRDWEQDDVPANGPIGAIHWVGDTGIDRDQIFGCYIIAWTRRIVVTTKKLEHSK